VTGPTSPFSASAPRQATFREFLAVVFRRRWIILGIFLVTTATVATLTLITPAEYLSSGRVLVRRGEQTSAFLMDRRVYDDWEQDLGSEVELARSEPVLDHARALLKAEAAPGDKPPRVDRRSVDVQVMGKSNVLGIAYVSRDPKVAQQVCDAVLRAYVEFRQTRLGMISFPGEFFRSSLAEVRADLDRALARRQRYTDATQVADVVEERRGLINEAGSLRLKESEISTKLAEARTSVRVMRALGENPEIDTPIPPNPFGSDPVYDLGRRLVEQNTRIAQLLERYREESAEVQNARQTASKIRALLHREVEAKIEVAQSQVEVLESQLAQVQKDLADRESRLRAMPEKEMALSELDREISVLRMRYADMVEKSDLARVTQNTTSNLSVLILERPGPAEAANARDWVRLGLAPAFSLLVGIGLAFFIDGLDITIRTAGQAEEASNIPVLASVSERRRRRA
jgi:uncharacterized protein involved in exopolysaccharide biosynthesis